MRSLYLHLISAHRERLPSRSSLQGGMRGLILTIALALMGCFEPSRRPSEMGPSQPNDFQQGDRRALDRGALVDQRDEVLQADASPFMYPARVRSVIDGDTIEVLLGENTEATPLRVRFKGVNTPELSGEGAPEPFAEEARALTWTQIGATVIGLEFDSDCAADPYLLCYDGYNRLLAYVRTREGEDLAALLIEAGLAQAYQFRNERFDRLSLYRSLEVEAQRARRGIWGE